MLGLSALWNTSSRMLRENQASAKKLRQKQEACEYSAAAVAHRERCSRIDDLVNCIQFPNKYVYDIAVYRTHYQDCLARQ